MVSKDRGRNESVKEGRRPTRRDGREGAYFERFSESKVRGRRSVISGSGEKQGGTINLIDTGVEIDDDIDGRDQDLGRDQDDHYRRHTSALAHPLVTFPPMRISHEKG